MDRGEFKHQSLMLIRKDQKYQKVVEDLVGKVMSSIRPDIMEAILQETDPDTINILISASPADYVKLVAKELGWTYLASEINNNKFMHCYGETKIKLLRRHYPENKFVYNFAISDSQLDISLLGKFKNYVIVSS
jgi:phosphoserine phosphatase